MGLLLSSKIMFTPLTNFFLTQLIWSITGGLYHLIINSVLLFLLLKLWDHLKWTKALLLSLCFNSCAFIIFIIFDYGIFVWGLNVSYALPPNAYQGVYDYLNTSLLFAALFIFLQTVQLVILNQWIHLNIWRIFLSIVCSNTITALLVYKIFVKT